MEYIRADTSAEGHVVKPISGSWTISCAFMLSYLVAEAPIGFQMDACDQLFRGQSFILRWLGRRCLFDGSESATTTFTDP